MPLLAALQMVAANVHAPATVMFFVNRLLAKMAFAVTLVIVTNHLKDLFLHK
ncbi:88_t:CDS:2 [Racocetra fulgida]|uniref:88_t:CDS:1 n=1 Tax=Racocetra fulgida TaxID=60492 RepID=A0A9N8WGZ1_9GLOM|nr:88_t:CDS:2 [Racocetra fulgida]